MKKIISFLLLFAMCISLCTTAAFAYATRVDDRFIVKRDLSSKNDIFLSDFATMNVGEKLSGYTTSVSQGSLEIQKYADGEAERTGLVFVDKDTSANYTGPNLIKNIDKLTSGNILIETRFKMTEAGSKGFASFALVASGGGSQVTSVLVPSGGNMSYYNGDSAVGEKIKLGEWYTVKLLIDLDAGKAQAIILSDAFTRGFLFGHNLSFRSSSPGYVDRIAFECRHYDATFVVDYLKAERNAEPLVEPDIPFVHPDPIIPPYSAVPAMHAVYDKYNVAYNNMYMYFATGPYLEGEDIMVTLRSALKVFGVTAVFDGDKFSGETETLKVSGSTAGDITVNGSAHTLTKIRTEGSKTLVSLNELSAIFGKNASYDAASKTLWITD